MPKTKLTPIIVFSVMAMLCIAFNAPNASASALQTLTLTQSQAFGSGNYGTVTLTLIGNTIQVGISIPNGTIIDTGGHSAVAFNELPPTPITVTGLPSGYALVGGAPPVSPGAFDQTGFFGTYEFAITGPGPSNPARVSSLTFVVSRGGGFTDVEQLMQNPNPAGSSPLPAVFAVDILLGSPACTQGACTGLVGTGTPPTQTPESNSLMLLGTGLTGLAILRRRFSKN